MQEEADEETDKVLFEVAGVRMADLQGPGTDKLEANQAKEASQVAAKLPSVSFLVCETNSSLKLLHFVEHRLVLLFSVLLLVLHLLQYLRQVSMSICVSGATEAYLAIFRISGKAAYFFFKLFW